MSDWEDGDNKGAGLFQNRGDHRNSREAGRGGRRHTSQGSDGFLRGGSRSQGGFKHLDRSSDSWGRQEAFHNEFGSNGSGPRRRQEGYGGRFEPRHSQRGEARGGFRAQRTFESCQNQQGGRGNYEGTRGRGGYKDRGGRYGHHNGEGRWDGGYEDRGGRYGHHNGEGRWDGGYEDRGGRYGYHNEKGRWDGGYEDRGGRYGYHNEKGRWDGGGDDQGGSGHHGGEGGRGFESRDNGSFAPHSGHEFNKGQHPRAERRPNFVPREEESIETLFDQHGIESGINFEKYSKIPIQASGENVPNAIEHFSSAGFGNDLMNNITRAKYKTPTPVQKNAIPIIMEGRDLMGCAQTGSGKTAAYLLPIIHRLLEDGVQHCSGHNPNVIVLAPTRELAIQIKDESRKFAANTHIKSVVVYGGPPRKSHIALLSRGANILVATPGRLFDFLESGEVSFRNVKVAVLDEADRMLEMGFRDRIQMIMKHKSMPNRKNLQTLMFSATFPSEIQQIADEYLINHVFLRVGQVGGACSDVTQTIFEVSRNGKKEKLMDILKDLPGIKKEKTLIFVEKKKTADFLACILCEDEYEATSIHGDRYQDQREEALLDFKHGRRPILVATSVAARGLDIPEVAHVINYDLPTGIDDYVHRIGRTGRIGNKGRATSFFDPDKDGPLSQLLINKLSDSQQEVPMWLHEVAKQHLGGRVQQYQGSGGRDYRKNKGQERDGKGVFGASGNNQVLEEDEMWE